MGLYREYASFPSLVSARITSIADKTVHVSSVWSQRDLERKENVKFSKTYFIPGEGAKGVISSAPQETKNEYELLLFFFLLNFCCLSFYSAKKRYQNCLWTFGRFLPIILWESLWSNKYCLQYNIAYECETFYFIVKIFHLIRLYMEHPPVLDFSSCLTCQSSHFGSWSLTGKVLVSYPPFYFVQPNNNWHFTNSFTSYKPVVHSESIVLFGAMD